eukprot:Nk52_evm7s2415 gene=Nk52_evmTU7s2415
MEERNFACVGAGEEGSRMVLWGRGCLKGRGRRRKGGKMWRGACVCVILVAVVLCSSSSVGLQGVEAVDVHVGSVLPHFLFEVLVGLYTGLEDYGGNLGGGVVLKYSPNTTYNLNDGAVPIVGLKHASALLNLGVVTIFGAIHSSVSSQIAPFAAVHGLPLYSPLSTSPALSEKKNYPTFVRAIANDNADTFGLASLIYYHGWRSLDVITTDDTSAEGITNILKQALLPLNISVASTYSLPFGIDRLEKRGDVRTLLNLIKPTARVIVLSAITEDARAVLEEAIKLGMNSKRYMWVATNGWAKISMMKGWTYAKDMVGAIGVSNEYDTTTDSFQRYLASYRRVARVIYNTDNPPENLPSISVKGYDLAHHFCAALNATTDRLQALGIPIECLSPQRYLSDSSCLLSTSERDSIYQDSVTKMYNGVKETMEFVKAQDGTYGPMATYPSVVLLHELYKTEIDGVTSKFKLDSNGDGTLVFNYTNLRPVELSDGSFEYKWVSNGYADLSQESNVTLTSKTWFPGSTFTEPNFEVPGLTAIEEVSSSEESSNTLYIVLGVSGGVFIIGVACAIWRFYVWKNKLAFEKRPFLIDKWDIKMGPGSLGGTSALSDISESRKGSVYSCDSGKSMGDLIVEKGPYLAKGKLGYWQGKTVSTKALRVDNFDVHDNTVCKELYNLYQVRHANIVNFYGLVVSPPVVFKITEYCAKGPLEGIIFEDSLHLDSLMVYSIITDILKGLKYIHSSDFICHGRLSPKTCLIDNKWTCKLQSFGLDHVISSVCYENTDTPVARQLLWTAPELMNSQREFYEDARKIISERRLSTMTRKGSKRRTTIGAAFSMSLGSILRKVSVSTSHTQEDNVLDKSQSGDIWAIGVILLQILTRDTPFGFLEKEADEIVAAVERNDPCLFEQEIQVDEQKDALKQNALECLQNDEQKRVSVSALLKTIEKSNPHKGSSIADNMAAILQHYADNLEEIVHERTAQLQEKSDALQAQTNRVEALLYEMLPKSIAAKLLAGTSIEPEHFKCISVFFSDIVGFTSICSVSKPLQVISFLNELYTKFDTTLSVFDVYKVETIGDAYFVVSGVPERNGNGHAKEICMMALNLLADMQGFTLQHLENLQLQLRIGIHSGPCVAGVVGVTMPHYTVYGDTINTASRMESGGLALRIHLSSDTADILQKYFPSFELEERGTIKVKGKGDMTTYWLMGESSFRRSLPCHTLAASASQHSFK